MIIVNDIMYKFIWELESPEKIFNMVMCYAERAKKNKWKALGQVLDKNKFTVIFFKKYFDNGEEKWGELGYINGNVTEYNEFFLNHGYLEYPVSECSEILDMALIYIKDEYLLTCKKVMLSSNLKGFLWKKYGFDLSREKLYEKNFPKEVNVDGTL